MADYSASLGLPISSGHMIDAELDLVKNCLFLQSGKPEAVHKHVPWLISLTPPIS